MRNSNSGLGRAKHHSLGYRFALPRLLLRAQEGSGKECARGSEGGGVLVHYITLLQYNASFRTIMLMQSGKKLGENLKKLRLKNKLSQGDLAKKLEVDRAYISNIENGRMNPTLSTLEKIAGALGISSSELLK
jgi:DNA-binding XRE family transcriptional regulator